MDEVDVIIIGGGPAGYTAGMYCGRAGLNTKLFEGGPLAGGQLAMTNRIENFPGFSGLLPVSDLLMAMKCQADKFGAEVSSVTVGKVDLWGKEKKVWSQFGTEYVAKSIIIATGAIPKMLGLADEEKFIGSGLSTCAVCDAYFFKDKTVGVVGGGDSACEEALHLAQTSKHVYMFVRRNAMRASDIMQSRVNSNSKITIKYNTEVKGLIGDTCLAAVETVNNSDHSKEVIAMEGLFYAIGLMPNSELFREQLALDLDGYIITAFKSNQTSVSGVFAAGDVTDYKYKQAVISAASGASAALDAIAYIQTLN